MKKDQQELMSCACCDKKGEIRLKVSLCSECFSKIQEKYEKEPKPYDETNIEEENKYWGF